jgi:glycosyltransferase involved in cell wall biosynthesis
MKRLCIILPEESLGAVGGFKVAYLYANALVRKGVAVSIVYVSYFHKKYPKRYPLRVNIKKVVKYLLRRYLGKMHQQWYQLAPSIEIHTIFSLNKNTLPGAEWYMATSIGSAITLNTIQGIKAQQKYYLIQHYEEWGGIPSALVDESYRYPMNKVCIAPWLVEKVKQQGKEARLIPNGFNHTEFFIKKPVESRENYSIAFLGAKLIWKGVEDTIAALELVREKYPRLVVNAFGTSEKDDRYPEWVTYTRLPSHETLISIYNNAAIFVGASHVEGFGLTIGEAMCCGCAIACTDNGGFSVMVNHEKTGLLSPIKDPMALAANIIRLIENSSERIRLAKQGNEFIQKFTWEASVDKLLDFLEYPIEIEYEK